tara:strand:- start:6382 stop:7323 length:942 start_codon:yes stop_codon:yes gene_type:complete
MALTRKTWLIAKIESSEGTDPTPVGGSNAIQVTNVEVTPIESDNVQAAAMQGFLGNSTRGTVLANKRVSVTFSTELSGSGAAGTAPAYGPLLKSVGLSETVVSSTSVTYAPVSASFSSCTIYCFYDGTRHRITGARGTVSFNLVAGQIASADFQFIGIYNAPDATAMSGTWTLANQAAGLEVNDTNVTTATFHGATSQRIESFDLALNNELIYKETASSKQALITNRAPGGTAVIEAPAIGSTDWFAKASAVTTGATDIILGASAGNIVRLKADYTDITGASYGDTNGVRSLNLPYLALPSTAGNNEMSLIYT